MEHRIPDTIAKCADLLYKLREKREGIKKQADEIEDYEKSLKAYIIDNLEKDNATGVSGLLACVRVVKKEEPTAENWDDFYKYILKNKAFHLLNKAINKASIKEIWEEGKEVPGVGRFNVITVSLTKVK